MPNFLSQVTGAPVDPAAGTAGVRTLGTGAQQAAAGNHGHTASDVGLGNVDNTSNATERAAVRTLTNARVTKRVGSTASSSSLTIDSDSYDAYKVTALAAAMTMNNPSGTPTDFQQLMIKIKDNGTARALTWSGTQWRAMGVTLPATTVISKILKILAVWDADDTKWDVISVAQQV